MKNICLFMALVAGGIVFAVNSTHVSDRYEDAMESGALIFFFAAFILLMHTCSQRQGFPREGLQQMHGRRPFRFDFNDEASEEDGETYQLGGRNA
jgi:hypothetical protein